MSAGGVAGDAATDPALLLSLFDARTPAISAKDVLWEVLGRRLFRLSFHNWYGVRRGLLRMFGASVGTGAKVRPTVRIRHPGNLTIGRDAAVGDCALLTCVAPISLGVRSTVSQHAHLCSGSHDCSKRGLSLVSRPIRVGDDAWVATDVFVFPGVTIGARCVVGARSTVRRDLPAGMICAGEDARPVWPRGGGLISGAAGPLS